MPHSFRPATADDLDFLYRLHVAAMREWVERTWGWDEAVQLRMFTEAFDPGPSRIVVVGEEEVGVIAVERRPDELFLANIELLPEHQRRGLGTALIRDVIAEGQRRGLPVSLRVLKVNPARRLYARLGFVLTGETGTHDLMRRPVS